MPGIEGGIKLLLVALIISASAAVWLLPRRRARGLPVIGERLFVATYVVGCVCGAAGLIVMFAWPQRVVEWHLWELAAMPLVLLYAYWIALMRAATTVPALDEKQDFDMTKAGAMTWAMSVPVMVVPFMLQKTIAFDASLWFPYYLFVTLLVNSALTLYYYRRA